MFDKKLQNVIDSLKADEIELADFRLLELGNERVKAILTAAEGCSKLKTLNLTDNEISQVGSTAVALLLKRNKSIQKLILDLNNLDIEKIAEGLKVNTTLEELYIGYNTISIQGFRALFAALEKNTTLRKLGLADTGLREDAVILLAHTLRINRTITHLNISRNAMIGVRGLHHLVAAIRDNKTLASVNLCHTNISGAENSRLIESSLRHSWNLTSFFFSFRNSNIGRFIRRNKGFASKIFQLRELIPHDTGAEYHAAVYKLELTFWDMQKLFNGGYNAVLTTFDMPAKYLYNLKRLEGYLYLRDVVLGDIKNCIVKKEGTPVNEKLTEFLRILREPLQHVHDDFRDRYLLNLCAEHAMKDRRLQTVVTLSGNVALKRKFNSAAIQKIIDALTLDELKYLHEDQSQLLEILSRVDKQSARSSSSSSSTSLERSLNAEFFSLQESIPRKINQVLLTIPNSQRMN